MTHEQKRQLLIDFFKFFRDKGEAYIGMSIEQFADKFIKEKKFKMKKLEITDWTKADKNGTIHVPDELDKIFNRVGMQLRFHTISGKNEVQTISDIVHSCQEFFKQMYDGKEKSKS